MDKVASSGKMQESTKVVGTRVSSMESAFTLTIMESGSKVSGKKANVRNGSTETVTKRVKNHKRFNTSKNTQLN